jgi:hypothetical protein
MLTVWTYAYFPFTIGGNVWQPISTVVETPVAITKTKSGIFLAVIRNPKTNHFHVAEVTTGAFVGFGTTHDEAIKEVLKDLSTADKTVVMRQLKDAAKKKQQAHALTPEEFWSKNFRG